MLSLHTRNLYKQLREDIRNSSMIYILSSFLMKSGIDVIINDLQYALKNGADIKLLTGDYLFVTDPEALEKLLEIKDDNLEIRMWRSEGISFHPKSFIFKHKEEGALIVGSPNMSRSALHQGVEWNLRMVREASKETFDEAIHHFISLFYADNTITINNETIKGYKTYYDKYHVENPNLAREWTVQEKVNLTLPESEDKNVEVLKESDTKYNIDIKPRQAQIEALDALDATVAEEYNRAMVVMATGLGKTYLTAMFAKNFRKVLFVAHRQEIIRQAKESFELVHNKKGGLLYGLEKDPSHDMVFASIFTLSI